MNAAAGSKTPKRPPSLTRYVTSLRRATYAAQHRKPRPRRGSLRKALRTLYVLTFKKLRFARPWRRPLKTILVAVYTMVLRTSRILRNAMHGIATAIYNLTFAYRHAVRRVVRRVLPRRARFVGIRPSIGLMTLSQRLITGRIPIVSSLTLNITHGVLMSMLGTQIAAGHLRNTLTLARIVNLAFRPYIRARRLPVSFLYFQALFHARQYNRIIAEVPRTETINHHYLNHIIGVAHLYSDSPTVAIYYLKRAIALNDRHPLDFRMLGRAHLRLGDEIAAARCFRTAITLAPNTVMAHQNYAGRYDIPNYVPKAWEIEQAERLMLYDNYGQLAEDTFLLGRFAESFWLYQRMLDYQERLRSPLPASLIWRLTMLDPRIDRTKPIRMLPYEWVTQFGHIGLLDSYIKMAKIGMYPDANYVLLAPKDKVSNQDYLAYWDRYFTIVRDPDLVNELFPYQRMIGDNFMAYPATDGVAEPWTRAAARAQIIWAQSKRPPLLTIDDTDKTVGAEALTALGVPNDAWYVSLHVREGGYYGESACGMSTHRNSAVEDYLPAICAVTERGGYVIRLGDSSMRPLPDMERVVDYANSPAKSAKADIFFCATSRFVIGTTSGLTTACQSFGTPMLLVNCISNDWQLWSDNTDFIVKPIWHFRDKRYLTFAETYSQPVQGYLINADVMRRHGLEAPPNSADEIEAATRYKLDLMDGILARPQNDQEPMAAYRRALATNPQMFGAAYPVPDFLARHRDLLSAPDKRH